MGKTPASNLGPLYARGALILCAALALFFLLQSHSLWASPTLVPDRWPNVFYPLSNAFPGEWILAQRASGLGTLNAILFLVIMVASFGTYLSTVRRLFAKPSFRGEDSRRILLLILGVAAGVLLIFFFVPGMFSGDLHSYISYGRISAVYGDNPFISTPADYAWYDTQGWIQWVVWQQTPSAYGPVWLGIAHVLALLANALGGDIVTHLLAHKALACIAHLLNVVLLWKVSGLVVTRYWHVPAGHIMSDADRLPVLRAAITLTYAWNPLALVEFGISGHNDVLIITCLLAAIWLHLSSLWRAAAVAIALGGLIKVTAFIFLPGYVWLLFWDGRDTSKSGGSMLHGLWRTSQALMLTLVACVVAYAPFWAGTQTLAHLSGGPAAHFFIHSLGAIIRFKLAGGLAILASWLGWQPAAFWTAGEISRRLDWPARWGLLAISAVAAIVVTWKARSFPSMVAAWRWALFFYLTVGSVWYWPWYATWLLVPAALYGPGRAYNAVQILTASSLAVYVVWPGLSPPLDWLTDWTGLIVALPPLAYLGLTAILERKRVLSHSHRGQSQPVPGSAN